MKDEVYRKIIEWIENISLSLGEEIPQFVQEVANYGVYRNLSIICVLFLLFISGLYFVRFFYKKIKDNECYVIPVCMIIFVLITVFLLIVVSIDGFMKAKYAPRLYVIEKFFNR